MDEEARTLWCGNLSDKVTEEILFELFLQAAPLERVRIPSINGRKSNYAFVTVKHEVSVDYVVQLLDGTCLYGRNITIKPRNNPRKTQQPPLIDANDLLLMGQLLQPFNQPFQQQNHNKPYHRHEYSGRTNRSNHHRNSQKEWNRRRY